jgi:hypothetical protein
MNSAYIWFKIVDKIGIIVSWHRVEYRGKSTTIKGERL